MEFTKDKAETLILRSEAKATKKRAKKKEKGENI